MKFSSVKEIVNTRANNHKEANINLQWDFFFNDNDAK